MRFLVRVLINAVALWLTTLLVSGVRVSPFSPIGSDPGTPGGTLELVLTFLIVAAVFGIVNGVIGNAIRIVAFPLYVLTLGLLALVVNGLLLMLVAWLTGFLGFGLTVESFWWGVLGAFVLGVFSWLIGIIVRPLVKQNR